jgi:ElaB/YqjD/DUF883 family membrane-anchored ribosome-binding protein
MTNSNAKIAELRGDSERTRAALTASVRELKDKVGDAATEVKTIVSPAHIKNEVANYAREAGSNFVDALTQRAKDNPLQAIAAGAAIGFPMLKLLRAVPTPLLLIGAGFWLSGQGGRRALDAAAQKASEAIDDVKDNASDLMASATQTASSLTDKGLSDVTGSLSANVTPMADAARRGLHDAQDAASDLGRKVMDRTTELAGNAATTVSDASRAATDRVMEAGAASKTAVVDFTNNNPLLTAALGIAAGALIAASLPASSAEQRVFGASSARLKRAGRDAINDSLDKVSGIADDALNSARDATKREGLDLNALNDTVNDVAARTKAVADKGLRAAFDGLGQQKGAN